MVTRRPGRFLFIGNHPGLDFLNTRPAGRGGPVELLRSLDDLLAWLLAAGLVRAAEARRARKWSTRSQARQVMQEAWKLRTLLRESVERRLQGKPVPAETIQAVNRALERRSTRMELARNGKQWELREDLQVEQPQDLLVPIAQAAADLLADAEHRLIRKCGNPRCVLYFWDTTKNRRRRWCSMKACGNRMKAAAHYHRSRR